MLLLRGGHPTVDAVCPNKVWYQLHHLTLRPPRGCNRSSLATSANHRLCFRSPRLDDAASVRQDANDFLVLNTDERVAASRLTGVAHETPIGVGTEHVLAIGAERRDDIGRIVGAADHANDH